MRSLTFCPPILLLLTLPTTIQQSETTGLQAKLNARVTQYNISANGLADALAKTSKQFEFPVGIEWLKNDQALTEFRHTWTDETVIQILRSIVESYAGYDLNIEDGVVHVFRRDLVNSGHNFSI